MAKYWATCVEGLEFIVAKELEELDGTSDISQSLMRGGVLFTSSSPPEELLKLRSADNIFAYVAYFQDLPLEREAAILYFKNLAKKVDWGVSFKTLRSWNKLLFTNDQLEPNTNGVGPFTFRVSCDRKSTNVTRHGRHGFTSVEAEAAIGEGIHYLLGWPGSMRSYDLEVMTWIRDTAILLTHSLLNIYDDGTEKTQSNGCEDDSVAFSDNLDPLLKTAVTKNGEKLRPRPKRLDSQLYAKRCYRKMLVETSLKPSTAFSLLQIAEIQPGHVILDPMCGCGTIPLEAAEYYGSQVKCIAADFAEKAIAATERNCEGLKEQCDILHWDSTCLPLRTGCVDRIVCDMPFGVRCGSTRVRQWLCPKVLKEIIRVLVPGTGVAVLMVQGKFMRREIEDNSSQFVNLLQTLKICMEGIRVDIFVMKRTFEQAPNMGFCIGKVSPKRRIGKLEGMGCSFPENCFPSFAPTFPP